MRSSIDTITSNSAIRVKNRPPKGALAAIIGNLNAKQTRVREKQGTQHTRSSGFTITARARGAGANDGNDSNADAGGMASHSGHSLYSLGIDDFTRIGKKNQSRKRANGSAASTILLDGENDRNDPDSDLFSISSDHSQRSFSFTSEFSPMGGYGTEGSPMGAGSDTNRSRMGSRSLLPNSPLHIPLAGDYDHFEDIDDITPPNESESTAHRSTGKTVVMKIPSVSPSAQEQQQFPGHKQPSSESIQEVANVSRIPSYTL
jgi:hypothetical protein